MSWRNFIGHSRDASLGIDEFIRDHEDLHRRFMQDLKPANFYRHRKKKEERQRRQALVESLKILDPFWAFIFLDAMNLTDAQYDSVLSMATQKYSEDLTYRGGRAAVKRLYGREARAI